MLDDAPDGLGEAGLEVWEAVRKLPWVKSSDEGTVRHLCRLEDEAANLVNVVHEQGAVDREPIVSPRGEVVGHRWTQHPLINELRKLDTQLVGLRKALGLDPASRARVGIGDFDKRPDRLDELKARRADRLAQQKAAYVSKGRS